MLCKAAQTLRGPAARHGGPGVRRGALRGDPHRHGLGRRGRRAPGEGSRRDGRDPEPGDRAVPRHAAVAGADDGRHRRQPGGDRAAAARPAGRLLRGAAARCGSPHARAAGAAAQASGHRLRRYSQPTIQRRLQRRMADTGQGEPGRVLRYLQRPSRGVPAAGQQLPDQGDRFLPRPGPVRVPARAISCPS